MAGWNPRSEKPGLVANYNGRPADVFIPSYTNGIPCTADIAVTHALQPNSITYAARVSGGAATRYAVKMKYRKYKYILTKQSFIIEFLPFVVDWFDAWDPTLPHYS